MILDVSILLVLIIAIVFVYKLQRHTTKTIKTILIIGLLVLAYVSFMNILSEQPFDLTKPGEILEAVTYHIGGIFTWITNIWESNEQKTTGNAIKEKDKEERKT